jgi:uncharacterized protein (DUF433 family)/DNA-binding transcriptional MerR regulator
MPLGGLPRGHRSRMATVQAAPDRPLGWYLAREVGWLAGVSGDRVGQWARRGYIQSSRSSDSPRVYSFDDVAEAVVVHELVDRGVPHREILATVRNLRDTYGRWPLTAAPISTSELHRNLKGKKGEFLILNRGGEQVDIGRGEGAETFLPSMWDLKAVNALLRSGGWVLRDYPDIKHIEVDPERLGGTPTIRNRRIPAEKVAVLAHSNRGIKALREDYELSDDEITDARTWFRAVTAIELAA